MLFRLCPAFFHREFCHASPSPRHSDAQIYQVLIALSLIAPSLICSSLYPCHAAFHYQSDGWMSDRSAEVYEHSTETLFFGRQDAMQRSSLVPISKYISSSEKPLASMRLLEVSNPSGRASMILPHLCPPYYTRRLGQLHFTHLMMLV